jgi:ATP-dependent Clp protease ATP-binding subunit ClpC
MESEVNFQFEACPQCAGSGRQNDNENCASCLGDGIWLKLEGKNIYFNQDFSPFFIFIFKIKKVVAFLFKLCLIIFSCLGFLSLLQAIFFLRAAASAHWFFAQPPEFLMIIFWFSLSSDLFLIYLRQRDKEEKNTLTIFKKSTKINVKDFLDNSAKRVIETANLFAIKLGQAEVEPIHLFIGVLQQKDGAIITTRLGIVWSELKEKITKALSLLPHNFGRGKIQFSLAAKKVLIKSFIHAFGKKGKLLSPLEILFYLATDDGKIKSMLDDFDVKPTDVNNVIIWREVYQQIGHDWKKLAWGAGMKGRGKINVAMTAVATPFLDSFSQDLTELAKRGFLLPCMDREKETEEIFRILEGGRKNLVLVGPPGVGKTTIIEGLARRMIAEDVPKELSDKRLVSLSLSRLIAGAQAPGEIEQRLQIILSEIVRAGNIALFIKDIHNLIGVKTTQGELDISEMLAEALRKKHFLLLSSSVTGDYERYLENSSLGQNLSKIKIEEPGQNETILILESKVASLEAKNNIFFSYQSLVEAVNLARRYIYEKFLPDKAIALIEEVAVYVKNKKGRNAFVTKEDVAELVSKKTGIPSDKVSQAEANLLLNLEEKIHQRIIGQDEAVKAVATALKRARTELRDPKRPIVNLLFLGPTGVGKTELAKTVADIYFGSEKKMIRLDMSEFQTKESIGHLIGDRSDPRGVLTEAVRKNPFTLLLLDEIEKAHPDILNLFLQVMDDGRLTDWQGKTIDFTNLILIGTSNAASEWLQNQLREGKTIEQIKESLVKQQLAPYFKPEFLNRFDGIMVFRSLSLDDLKAITKLLLGKLKEQLEAKGIFFEATEQAIEELAQQGFDPIFGARPLRRTIQDKVNDAIANFLLSGKISRRDLVIFDQGGKIRIEKDKLRE